MRKVLNIGSLVLIVAVIIIKAAVLPGKTIADTKVARPAFHNATSSYGLRVALPPNMKTLPDGLLPF